MITWLTAAIYNRAVDSFAGPDPDTRICPNRTSSMTSSRARWRNWSATVAVVAVVEKGLVPLLDPRVTLPEQSRVIVVASEPA